MRPSSAKVLLLFLLFITFVSCIKFDNQHDAGTAAIVLLTIRQIFLDCIITRDKFTWESCKNMQKPPCGSSFSNLLYDASLYTTILHWLKFFVQGKVKVADLILAFFNSLFALKMCSTVAWLTEPLNSLKYCLMPIVTDQ